MLSKCHFSSYWRQSCFIPFLHIIAVCVNLSLQVQAKSHQCKQRHNLSVFLPASCPGNQSDFCASSSTSTLKLVIDVFHRNLRSYLLLTSFLWHQYSEALDSGLLTDFILTNPLMNKSVTFRCQSNLIIFLRGAVSVVLNRNKNALFPQGKWETGRHTWPQKKWKLLKNGRVVI